MMCCVSSVHCVMMLILYRMSKLSLLAIRLVVLGLMSLFLPNFSFLFRAFIDITEMVHDMLDVQR